MKRKDPFHSDLDNNDDNSITEHLKKSKLFLVGVPFVLRRVYHASDTVLRKQNFSLKTLDLDSNTNQKIFVVNLHAPNIVNPPFLFLFFIFFFNFLFCLFKNDTSCRWCCSNTWKSLDMIQWVSSSGQFCLIKDGSSLPHPHSSYIRVAFSSHLNIVLEEVLGLWKTIKSSKDPNTAHHFLFWKQLIIMKLLFCQHESAA